MILGISSLVGSMGVKSNTVHKEIPLTILISSLLMVLAFDNMFDSSEFNTPTGHENPVEVKYESERFETEETLKVGAYSLISGFKKLLGKGKGKGKTALNNRGKVDDAGDDGKLPRIDSNFDKDEVLFGSGFFTR